MPGQKVLALGTWGDTGGSGCSWPCLGSGGGGAWHLVLHPKGGSCGPQHQLAMTARKGREGRANTDGKNRGGGGEKGQPRRERQRGAEGGERGAQGRILPSAPSGQRRRLGFGELGPIQPHSGAEPHTGSCRCQWPWWGHPESLRVHGDTVAVGPHPTDAPCCSRCPQAGSGTTLPGAIGG